MLGSPRRLLIVHRDDPETPPVAQIVPQSMFDPAERLIAALRACQTPECDISCSPNVAVRARLQQINRTVQEALQ